MRLFTQEPFGDLDHQDLLESTHNSDRGICSGKKDVRAWLEGSGRSVDTVHVELAFETVSLPSEAFCFHIMVKPLPGTSLVLAFFQAIRTSPAAVVAVHESLSRSCSGGVEIRTGLGVRMRRIGLEMSRV